MQAVSGYDPRLARDLILDELFDLSLYKALRGVTQPDVHDTLDELIKVETAHLAFWQKFGDSSLGHQDTVSVLPTVEIRPVKLGQFVPYANMSLESTSIASEKMFQPLSVPATPSHGA